MISDRERERERGGKTELKAGKDEWKTTNDGEIMVLNR